MGRISKSSPSKSCHLLFPAATENTPHLWTRAHGSECPVLGAPAQRSPQNKPVQRMAHRLTRKPGLPKPKC